MMRHWYPECPGRSDDYTMRCKPSPMWCTSVIQTANIASNHLTMLLSFLFAINAIIFILWIEQGNVV